MRRAALSAAVIVFFLVYSFLQRHTMDASVVVQKQLDPVSSTVPTPDLQPQTDSSKRTYKDGEYVGDVADAFYGYIQVKAVVENGQLSDVQFLQYPNDRQQSILINRYAMPILRQEALQAQTARVDVVSGATDSSFAFIQSLTSALSKAV
jgi:uncharacterized protein with FMN-binding domain